MKTVLVTGASGLIGRELTSVLLQKGYKVIGTDKNASPFAGQPNFSFIQSDIVDKGKLGSVFEGSQIELNKIKKYQKEFFKLQRKIIALKKRIQFTHYFFIKNAQQTYFNQYFCIKF